MTVHYITFPAIFDNVASGMLISPLYYLLLQTAAQFYEIFSNLHFYRSVINCRTLYSKISFEKRTTSPCFPWGRKLFVEFLFN